MKGALPGDYHKAVTTRSFSQEREIIMSNDIQAWKSDAAEVLDVRPVLADGGEPFVQIMETAERVPSLRALGVYGVAAIRGIWDDVDAGRAAIHYLSQHDRDGGG